MVLIKHPLNLGTQTFRMNRSNKDGTPKHGYFEAADCRRFECPHYLLGWQTKIDPSTQLGQKQTHYIRKLSGRSFTETPEPSGLLVFTFEAGQKCFRTHQLPVDRDPIFSNRVPGLEPTIMDYDEFHDTYNETIVRLRQQQREV